MQLTALPSDLQVYVYVSLGVASSGEETSINHACWSLQVATADHVGQRGEECPSTGWSRTAC